MDDIEFIIKQDDGTEIKLNTEMIDEDVLRLRMGLKGKNTERNETWN